MSKRKILTALKKKNIQALSIEYKRGCPTPSGYANGWDLEFSEDLETLIYSIDSECDFSTFIEFDDLKQVLNWIETLPAL